MGDFLLLFVFKSDHVLLVVVVLDVAVSETASEAGVPLPIWWLLGCLRLKSVCPKLLFLIGLEVFERLGLMRPDASLQFARGISLRLPPLVLAICISLGVNRDWISGEVFKLVAG